MKIILDNKFVTVSFIEEVALVRIVWKNLAVSFDTYKQVFTKALDFQESYHVVNFMSDIRKQKIMSPSFRKWFQDYAVPRAVKQGLKRGAVVFNGNVFKKYYLNHIMNTTKKFGLPFKFFNTQEEAINWMKTFKD